MAGLLRLAHHVEDHVAFRNVEVGVNFHPAFMGVGRHGVPDAALGQLGQTHGELAGLQYIRMDELVDNTLVAGHGIPAGALVGVREGQEGRLAGLVSRSGDQIESCRILRVLAAKADLSGTLGDVEAVLEAELEALFIRLDKARASQIEDTGFTPLQEIRGAEVGPDVDALVDGEDLMNGHDAEDDHTVDMGIGGLDGVRLIEAGDQELLPKLLGGIALDIIGSGGITDVHNLLSPFGSQMRKVNGRERGNPPRPLQ